MRVCAAVCISFANKLERGPAGAMAAAGGGEGRKAISCWLILSTLISWVRQRNNNNNNPLAAHSHCQPAPRERFH
jgi:hypothetical protein